MTADFIKAGADCVTRDGRRAHIYVIDETLGSQCVVGRCAGYLETWTIEGMFWHGECHRDLVGPWVDPKAGDA